MKKIILLIMGVMIFSACGYQEGIVQKGEKSFIQFSGNWENASVQVDDMSPFVLKAGADSEQSRSADKKLYQFSPGKHFIKVFRDGNLVVNRILLLDNQTTTEVIIP